MRCARRRRSPWFAWVPSGSTPSALALPPWKPIAVTRLWLTGSWRCSEPSLAITSGWGGPAGTSRDALAGAATVAGEPEPPNADRSSVTSATRAIAIRAARRRRRRSRSRCRRREAADAPVLHRGRHVGHRSERLRGFQREGAVGAERPVPVRGPEGDDARGSIGPVSAIGRPPRIEIPRWVQLVGLPLLLVFAWVFLTAAGHVVFLFLVADADRAPARPDRAGAPAGPAPARPLGRDRVPDLRGCAGARHRGGGDRGRRRDEDRGQQVQRLLHASCRRLRTDGGRPRRRPPADWLNTHHLKSLKVAEARPRLVRQIQRARRRQEHGPRRLVRRGRGDLDRQDALLRRAARRDLDLHAARHAEARTHRRPALPTATRRAAAAADASSTRSRRTCAGRRRSR